MKSNIQISSLTLRFKFPRGKIEMQPWYFQGNTKTDYNLQQLILLFS